MELITNCINYYNKKYAYFKIYFLNPTLKSICLRLNDKL